MGYLTESQAIVTNSEKLLEKIFTSKFTQFIQGLGQPVLGEWFNHNVSASMEQQGTVDVDHLIGRESPIRYNYIPNMPVYGINQNLVPEMTQLDGNLYDMNMEVEVVVLPNTFRPLPYDHYVYRFGENGQRRILFRVNNIQIGTIRNNSYYRVSLHMVDIDSDDLINGLKRQVVKTMVVDLDRIGTNENCIVEDTIFRKCTDVDRLTTELVDDYRSFFYSERYNSVLYQEDGGHGSYDPYLNHFIINTHMLESERNSTTMVVHDQDASFREEYNWTLWRALELGRTKYISKQIYWEPRQFTRNTMNPFDYYGIDYVYKVHIYLDPDNTRTHPAKYEYQYYPLLEYLEKGVSDGLGPIETAVVKYLLNPERPQDIFTDTQLEELQKMTLSYIRYYYEMIPIAVFLLRKYSEALRDNA